MKSGEESLRKSENATFFPLLLLPTAPPLSSLLPRLFSEKVVSPP